MSVQFSVVCSEDVLWALALMSDRRFPVETGIRISIKPPVFTTPPAPYRSLPGPFGPGTPKRL